MKIGIGIPTYNRLESLEKTVNSIAIHSNMYLHEIYVVVDGSSDGTREWVIDKNVGQMCNLSSIFYSENRGVCATKNDILHRFKGYDYVFIIEDDVTLLKHGLFALYIRAIEVFDIQHWNFLAPWQRVSRKPQRQREGLTMMLSQKLGGALSVYTKEVIEKVGAFNPEFKGYGYGHCEYTLRAHRAGLTTGWCEFAHLVDAEAYVQVAPGNGTKSKDERETERKENLKVLRKSQHDHSLIHIPLESAVHV